MNTATLTKATRVHWREYYALCKPKVVSLIIFTAVVGMLLASPDGLPPLDILVFGTLGIALGAASGAAINHWVDQRIDAIMERTQNRPLPQGQLSPRAAISFALMLGVLSMLILGIFVNLLTAVLTLVSLVGYAVVYTMFLKRSTPHNIVLGGAAGAAPPVLGWTAVTGEINTEALLLFLVIFIWTPPHFWALAIHRKEEYAAVNIPMLPVTHGVAFTKLHILLYTVIMFLITLLPFATRMSGPLYLLGAVVLGGGFLYWAIELLRGRNPNAPMETFKYSIVYLMALFVVMLVDHYLFPVSTL